MHKFDLFIIWGSQRDLLRAPALRPSASLQGAELKLRMRKGHPGLFVNPLAFGGGFSRCPSAISKKQKTPMSTSEFFVFWCSQRVPRCPTLSAESEIRFSIINNLAAQVSDNK